MLLGTKIELRRKNFWNLHEQLLFHWKRHGKDESFTFLFPWTLKDQFLGRTSIETIPSEPCLLGQFWGSLEQWSPRKRVEMFQTDCQRRRNFTLLSSTSLTWPGYQKRTNRIFERNLWISLWLFGLFDFKRWRFHEVRKYSIQVDYLVINKQHHFVESKH